LINPQEIKDISSIQQKPLEDKIAVIIPKLIKKKYAF
jgi:hypothetical protein